MNTASSRNMVELKSMETLNKISKTNATASLSNSIDRHDTHVLKTKSDEVNKSAFIGSRMISNIDATQGQIESQRVVSIEKTTDETLISEPILSDNGEPKKVKKEQKQESKLKKHRIYPNTNLHMIGELRQRRT